MSDSYEVKKLFEGVIPERLSEAFSLMEKHGIQFRVIDDVEGFRVSGVYGAVQYTKRAMHQLWLFGYAGMQSLHCYSSYLLIVQSLGLQISIDEIEKIPGQAEANKKFTAFADSVRNLNQSYSAADFQWQENVPSPDDGKSSGVEPSAVFDLTCMATAYIFLHEMKHALFYMEGNQPHNIVDEEVECDRFAREMMLSKISEYSRASGYPADKVEMKRAMGIALASAFMLLTTARDKITNSDTHPPVHSRWRATTNDISLPDNDYYWLYFASLALAMLRYLKIEISERSFSSYKELCMSLIKDLENGI